MGKLLQIIKEVISQPNNLSSNSLEEQTPIIPDAIHFKNVDPSEPTSPIIPDAIHFKNVDPSASPIDESTKTPDIHSIIAKMKKESHPEGAMTIANNGAAPNIISKSLQKKQTLPITTREKSHVYHYTRMSKALNLPLIANSRKKSKNPLANLPEKQLKVDKTLMRLSNQRLGRNLSVFSGTSFDPSEIAKKSSDRTMLSPAHISATHSPGVAIRFALESKKAETENVAHIAHIRMSGDDKAFHLGGLSKYEYECETVIPRGTKLRWHGTTKHIIPGVKAIKGAPEYPAIPPVKVLMHHFTVHSQEND